MIEAGDYIHYSTASLELRSVDRNNVTKEAASALGKHHFELLYGAVGRPDYEIEAEVGYIGAQCDFDIHNRRLSGASIQTSRRSYPMLQHASKARLPTRTAQSPRERSVTKPFHIRDSASMYAWEGFEK